jgi:hypothetical protein
VRPGPAYAGRPRFDIAAIVRRHRATLEAERTLTHDQQRVLSAIELCRTSALGGHLSVCRSCGYEHPFYNSCRNRHCPKCQALAQERWIAARSTRMLPVRHFHVVFTVPRELRALTKYRPRELFGALFSAASATLLELGRSRLKAQIGTTMVLHTWTRDLRWHPHVHAIVTAGGLALDGSSWRPSSNRYLFPIKVMGILLRGKMIAALRAMHQDHVFDGFDDLGDPQAFERLMSKLSSIDWIVYAKQPFEDAGHVLAYLGRYTHRVAISNSRLLAVTDEAVTFRTKNGKTTTLTPVEFLRRFIQHVLPRRFHKIRHHGLYASTHAKEGGQLENARAHLAPLTSSSTTDSENSLDWNTELLNLTGLDVKRCPRCGAGIERIALPKPLGRAPPKAPT